MNLSTLRLRRHAVLATCAALSIAAPAPAQPIQFTEVGASSGALWTHVDFTTRMGAGCAFFDADRDGRLDVIYVGGVSEPGLFLQQPDHSFVDVSATDGIFPPSPLTGHMGAFCADIDNDGDADLLITVDGFNRLYRSHGDGTFADITVPAGMSGPNSNAWGSCAAFGDHDLDGDLDLFVGNYVTVPGQPTPNLMYRNDGTGAFADITAATGLAGNGTALAAQWVDQDADGDLDLWLGNDLGLFITPNRLYRNDGPGPGPDEWIFTDVAPALNGDAQMYTMGLHAGDYDRDLDFDYYFSNIGRKLLLRDDGAAGFVDATTAAGLEGTYDPYQPGGQTASWGMGFHDFDRDGWLDVYVSHGYITPPAFVPSAQNVENTPNQLYRHDGPSLTFTNVAAAAGVEDLQMGRGCAFADYDGDGDVDIAQANLNGTSLLYRNDTAAAGRWLKVSPRGRISPRDPVGLTAIAEAGGVSHLRQVHRNSGYLSSHELTAHFGLGTVDVVDHLRLRWPSGATQSRYDLAPDTTVSIKEPYLSFDESSSFPTSVSEGNTLSIVQVLRNHTGEGRTAYYFTELLVGPVTWISPIFTTVVPADATTQAVFAVPVPVGVTGGQAIDLRFTWNLYDITLGHDQWRNDITITP